MADRPALSAAEADALLEGLPVTLPARQRGFNAHNTPPSVEDLVLEYGELTPDDHARAKEVAIVGMGGDHSNLEKIRWSHHRIAQMVAIGRTVPEISVVTGYSTSRLYTMRSAPAFQELVAHYKSQVTETFQDFVNVAGDLSLDIINELQERINENPSSFTNSMLNEVLKTVSDRSGNAPVSRSVNVNVTSDLASRMAAAERRLKEKAA